jgi:hypothetical protein
MSIRVFVGTEPKTEIAAQVLKHTILKNTQSEVEITFMIGAGWEYPIKDIKVGTGFSLRRWMIPKAAGWHGYAIYLDADQIVFADIAELWELIQSTAYRHPQPILWTTYQPDKYNKHPAPQTSVMGIDCGNAFEVWGFDIDKVLAHLRGHPTKEAYAKFMHAEWLKEKLKPEPKGNSAELREDDGLRVNLRHPIELPVEWNHLNVYKHGQTKLLHYTKENEQPWYKPDHKLAKHWCKALQDAIDEGLVTQEMLKEGLANWGKKQDWRPTNGLHPSYKKYLKA